MNTFAKYVVCCLVWFSLCEPEQCQNQEHPPAIGMKSELKCAEYSRNVRHSIDNRRRDSINHTSGACYLISTEKSYGEVGYYIISGGSPVNVGELPFMAAIMFEKPDDGSQPCLCGGTLISEFYVLTATHCFYCITKNNTVIYPKSVRLGDINLYSDQDGADHQDYTIASLIPHDDYQAPPVYNDIGLIKLSRKVTFTHNIRPACLWTKSRIETNQVLAAGYGITGFGEPVSETLLKVQLPLTNDSYCSYLFRRRTSRLPQGIRPTIMFCAGDPKSAEDTCKGDSGGPLLITHEDNDCMHYVVGITSIGSGCGHSLSAYTRVSAYIGWIESKIW